MRKTRKCAFCGKEFTCNCFSLFLVVLRSLNTVCEWLGAGPGVVPGVG